LALYDRLAGPASLGRSHWSSRDEVLRSFPDLQAEGLLGTYTYYDGYMDDHKLGLWAAERAAAAGVKIHTDTCVESISPDATVRVDGQRNSFDNVVNATGPWARELLDASGISARYDLDRIRGVFSRPEHKLAGQSYQRRVLVLDAAKGGVATAWMLYEMKARGIMPAALVLNHVNPIMVQGAALADFTMISGFDLDISKAIPNGALAEVDPTAQRPFIRLV